MVQMYVIGIMKSCKKMQPSTCFSHSFLPSCPSLSLALAPIHRPSVTSLYMPKERSRPHHPYIVPTSPKRPTKVSFPKSMRSKPKVNKVRMPLQAEMIVV
jgi:hypothetical protein